MISYETVNSNPSKFKIKVRLDKKHIGDIYHEQLTGGYYYKVKGSQMRGETFRTVIEVKRSLEGN